MTMKPTIDQVANLAGVSSATVSRVFSQKEYVSSKTKQAVMEAAERLHYSPRKYTRRNLVVSSGVTIGVIIADLHNTFFQQIIKGMTDVFNDNDISVFICNSDENPQLEIRYLSALIERRVDGIIISPASEAADYNQEFLQAIYQKNHIPIVLIDRDLKGIGLDGVFQDSFTAAFKATEVFIQNGHRNIAIIAGPTTSKPGLDRLHGYMEALKDNHIDFREEYILYGDFKINSGYLLTKKIIDNYPEVTAIYCSNNLMAVGALRALNNAGMAVPDDIGFISTGSLDEYSFFSSSNITELDLPAEEMGYECAHLMLERLQTASKRRRFSAKRITLDIPLKLKGSEKYPSSRL